MKKILTFLVVLCLASVASADLTPYSQDFEGMDPTDPACLANDGWVVFGNVFGLDWGYWYGYGVYPAPHGTCGFSSLALGEGGPDQGAKQLVVYSDYCNQQHGYAWIEANVFQEQVIGAADVGSCWTFYFDVKRGDLLPNSFSKAFIKTIDPANNWAMTNFLTVDTTALPQTWSSDSITIMIDAGLVGQLLQIGFLSTASEWTPSGMLYDNISFEPCIDVQVDIKPAGCPNPLNAGSQGLTSVAVLGSGELDVTTIDAASIRLEGVAPVEDYVGDRSGPAVGGECACTEDGPDGIDDLILKFKTQDLVAAIGEFSSGETVVLTLTGKLSDDTSIVGADCIRIKERRAKRPPK